jgi:hypothetical protein
MDELVQFEIEKPVTMVFRRFDRSDIDRIVDVLSEKLILQLWDINGRLILLDDGAPVPVSHAMMQVLVQKHFRTPQLAWRNGKGEVSLVPVSVDRAALVDLVEALRLRAGKAQEAPRELSYQQLTEIDERLRSGEPIQVIAAAYNVSLAKVCELRDAARG